MSQFFSYLKSHWELVVLLLFFGWLFFDLLSSHTLLEINGSLYSAGSTWGDLPYHLTLITNFKERGLIDVLKNDPLYFGEQTRYPFALDYFSSLLMKAGLNLRWSIILPSFIALLALVVLIYLLVLKITKKRVAAFLTPFLFILNGSTFALYYFFKDFAQSDQSLVRFIQNLSIQYTHLSQHQIEFSNVVADFLLPQRTIVLGLVFACLALYFLWNYWETKKSKNLLWAGIIIGLMPAVHTHLFLALVIFCGFLFLIQWIFYHELRIKDWLLCALPVLVLALGPTLWFFPFGNKSFFRVQWGWMAKETFFWLFWFKNLGLYLIFIIAGFIIALQLNHQKKITSFYSASIGIFVLANIFIFQPWEFDNTKIFMLWFLLSTVIIAVFFDYLFRKKSWGYKIIAFVLLLITLLPGILAVQKERANRYVLYSPVDQALAAFVQKNTKPTDLFLTTDKHNNPISSLAGRRILMGYRGWLWSHGIDYSDRYKDLARIYQGADDAYQLINKYSPDYILIERYPANDWVINFEYFRNSFPVVYENPGYILYKAEEE
ncbi:MAG: hypothetical protein PHF40_02505 [Candidatus Pacebacteria bacterium]|nr:hypothetical protein [Candidatus Paceibacterota bacterium]